MEKWSNYNDIIIKKPGCNGNIISTHHNESKSEVAKKFIRILKGKIS